MFEVVALHLDNYFLETGSLAGILIPTSSHQAQQLRGTFFLTYFRS